MAVTVETFPREVREIETLWIPLASGLKLAARMWIPRDAEENPVPAILEYIPYRRRDVTALRDSHMHPYIAGHGYACVRVDMRGSGDSDGVLTDEYLPTELQDGAEVIGWLARQKWCSGAVGMIGNSWGGFNALQVAALNPPALKAIVTSCSTDDRYADDVHYMGGCLLGQQSPLGLDHVRRTTAARRSPRRRRSLARAVDGAPRRQRPLDRELAASPAPRRVLAARLGVRGLRRHPVRGLRRRRLGGRLHERDPSTHGRAEGAEESADRPVGAPVPPHGAAGAGDRVPAGLPALVGQVAEGRRDGHRRRAADARVDAGQRAAPDLLRDLAGRWVAEPGWPPPSVSVRKLVLNPGRLDDQAQGETPLPILSPETRSARPPATGARTACSRTCRTTSASTTAARWCSTPIPCPRPWSSWARRWPSSSWLPTSLRPSSPFVSPTSFPRGRPPASRTACSISATGTATSLPRRSSPGSAIASGCSSTTWDRPFRRATAFAWPCRRRTGRSPGRRRSRRR